MKFYDLNTEFSFGKYKGNTIRQILDFQPSYLDWCAINLEHFYISEDVIGEIKNIKPDFALTAEGKQKMEEKYAKWDIEQESEEDYDNDYGSEGRSVDYDQTDWSNYDDGLDMDQQSIEFWNQF